MFGFERYDKLTCCMVLFQQGRRCTDTGVRGLWRAENSCTVNCWETLSSKTQIILMRDELNMATAWR